LKSILEKELDIDKLKNSGKKLLVGAISYKTGKYHYGTEKDKNIIDWILASSAFPVFFPMVEIDGEHYIDGGVLSVDLLYEIQKLGAKEIDIILTSPINLSSFEKFGLPHQFERTLDLMSIENLNNDIALCKLNNNVRIFMPKENFNISSLNFDPEKIKKIYNSGKNFEVNKL